jgi:hypothetical protein
MSSTLTYHRRGEAPMAHRIHVVHKRPRNVFGDTRLAYGPSINTLGREIKRPPITLAPINLGTEIVDDASRFIEYRVLRLGREAWSAINKAESFEGWKRIGAALAVGKEWALRTSGANCAWGSTYSKAFRKWVADHGFASMRPSDRSYAVALNENLGAITAWRDALPERRRKRLIGAQANVKRWRKETRHGNGKCPTDLKREAKAAWKRFVWCVRTLPAHEAAPLWQTALAELDQSRVPLLVG